MGHFLSKRKGKNPDAEQVLPPVPEPETAPSTNSVPEVPAAEIDFGSISQDHEILDNVHIKNRPAPPRKKNRKPPANTRKTEQDVKGNISEKYFNISKDKKLSQENVSEEKQQPIKPPRTSLGKLKSGDDNSISRLPPSESQSPVTRSPTNFLENLNRTLQKGPTDYSTDSNLDSDVCPLPDEQGLDSPDAVHQRLAVRQSDSVVENIEINSQDKEEKKIRGPKIFLKPRKSFKMLSKLATNISRNLSNESRGSISPTEKSKELEAENKAIESEEDVVDVDRDATSAGTKFELSTNPHQANLMAELNFKLKKNESVDETIYKPPIPQLPKPKLIEEPNSKPSKPQLLKPKSVDEVILKPKKPLLPKARFHSLEPHIENPTRDSSSGNNKILVEIVETVEAAEDAEAVPTPPVSPPSTEPSENFFLRPDKTKRTVTSIRLEEAFSILEDELFEKDKLENIHEDGGVSKEDERNEPELKKDEMEVKVDSNSSPASCESKSEDEDNEEDDDGEIEGPENVEKSSSRSSELDSKSDSLT